MLSKSSKRKALATPVTNNAQSFTEAVQLHRAGQFRAAKELYLAIIDADPGHADSLHMLAAMALLEKDHAQALVWIGLALLLSPSQAEYHLIKGLAYKGLRRWPEAEASLRQAVTLAPTNAKAGFNLGLVLTEQRKISQAGAVFRGVTELQPDNAQAWYNLANTMGERNDWEQTARCLERTLTISPGYAKAYGRALHARQHLCLWHDISELESTVLAQIHNGQAVNSPFYFLSIAKASAQEQLKAAKQLIASVEPVQPLPTFSSPTGKRIRIGYLSADFHTHATAYLIAEMLERHDRNHFEIFAYSYGSDDKSPMRQRLEQAVDHFIDIQSLPDQEAAQRIRFDAIQILIDLKGYTGGARINIAAARPSPIQVNFLGYPGTMGTDVIDYVIADNFCVPPGHDLYYQEKVVRLPHSYQPNDGSRLIASPPSRAECGLPDQGFVFCCFNNAMKIAPIHFDVWARLLTSVPGSVLWLIDANPVASGNLRRELTARHVDPSRLVFAPRLTLSEHLARHAHADLFLDTWPYNAHTTASDALWAGLPVLTMAGQTFASRVAGSLLTTLNLPELITHSPQDYERRALELASTPILLADIRAKLWANRNHSPLFDAPRFTRNLEQAFTRMWERYAAGQPPAALDIADSPHEASRVENAAKQRSR